MGSGKSCCTIIDKFSVLGAALKTYQRKGEGGERGERKGEKKDKFL